MERKRAVALWRARVLALYALLCMLLLPLTRAFPPVWLAVTLLTGIAAMACAYIRLYAQAFSLRFTSGKITVVTGVFVRRTLILPEAERIFTDIRSTPVERLLGLCHVRIYGRGKTLRILCLPHSEAEKIQQLPEGKE